ncbi:hypothetical protein [Pelagibacterium luteolum]|uniref:Uncharacterized protein n=1 Tax=Pelagibacterium luteolum TaxID=440168 RepID=A0A1G7UQ63_9HYPH|nr:hypothetical protein [Pelagibacterium luteolum]SDG49654.1 hypothetical protein SAMN04487974_103209 [Pelagibacterium luteolum]
MIILLYAAIGLAAITVIGNLMLGKWNAQRLDTRIGERADSYMASLEREGVPEAMAAMGDAERRDVLLAAGREVRAESDKRFYIATIGGIIAFFVALGFAIEGAGTRDFVIALLIAVAALYGLNVFLYRTFKSRMAGRGIDIDRLKTG